MNIIKILSLSISYIIMQFGIILGISILTKEKLKLNLRNIIILIIFCFLSYLNNFYNLTSLKIIFAFLITFIMAKTIYKQDYKTVFITVTIITILSILLELILSPLLALGISNIGNLKDSYLIKSLYSILNTFLLIYIIKNKYIFAFLNKLKIVISKFINFYTLSLILICFINIILYFQSSNLKNVALIIIAILSIILLLICLKVIINDKYNNKILIEKNKNIEDSYKAYSNIIDECRELKHNLRNDLYTLKSTLSKEQQDRINKLFEKYDNDYEWISKIDNIPEGLQGIVYLKSAEAKKYNVKIMINSNDKINIKNKNYIDICSIFSILLDNAIEASKKTSKKIIEINIYEKNKNKYITIINKFNNQININNIGKKNYSTKEYKSGIGLNYINKLKNNKIDVKISIINDLFISKIKFD